MSKIVFNPRQWVGVLLACCATMLVALAIPVHLPEGGARTDPSNSLSEDRVDVMPEDLDAFMASRRWGVSLNERTAPVKQDVPAINPALAEMGYVGLIAAKDQRAVLLALPEGEIVRMAPGDTLPDGRLLVSVTDNSLTLKGDGLSEDVLTLFPRIRTDHPTPDADGPGGGAGRPENAARAAAVSGSR